MPGRSKRLFGTYPAWSSGDVEIAEVKAAANLGTKSPFLAGR
jgi:hypothetical protein